MPGLKSSRWALRDHRDARDARSSSVPAPSTRSHTAGTSQKTEIVYPPTTIPQIGAGSATAELSRYSKIVRRMKWKLPFLDLAYRQATTDHGLDAASKAEVELMFKLDFFDYYMLCERALVHLQGVFGITIGRDSNSPGRVKYGLQTRTVELNYNQKHTHRYHANVLSALDMEENPLHAVLGVGDVRGHLARAKDLRNHWKNADDDTAKADVATGTRSKKTTQATPLSSYNLAEILTSIHQGLDKAFVVASKFVADCAEKQTGVDRPETNATAMDMEVVEDDEWGFMVDAMDWEAV